MTSKECPVCNAKNTIIVRNLRGQRTGKLILLYYCNSCYSMFNPSGYRENNDVLKSDLEWHINNFDEHKIASDRLVIKQLMEAHPRAKTFLDIGCGIGATVMQARDMGLEAEGVEPNRYAVDYAKEKLSLNLTCNYFRKDLYERKFDLIVCDQVLEHLENPRQLFEAAVYSLNRPGLIYISVPFRKDPLRQLIYTAFPQLPGTLFFDNDVHITHFSTHSMKRWAADFQADSYQFIKIAGRGCIFSFS